MKGVERRNSEMSPNKNTTVSYFNARPRWEDWDSVRVGGEQEEQRSRMEEDLNEDVLGEQITRILNQTPEFHYTQQDDLQEQLFRPVFCRQNLKQLCRLVNPSSLVSIPATLVTALRDLVNFLTKNMRTMKSTLQFFVVTITLSLILLVFACHKTLVGIIRTFAKYGYFITTLLIDTNELKSMCPEFLVWAWSKVVACVNVLDDVLLLGSKHAGREWNATSHSWKGGPDVSSRKDILFKCPPPSARHGRRRALDASRMPLEWSAATKKHIFAIHFCYVLLREDYVQRQRLKEQMLKEKKAESVARRRTFAKAKSEIYDIPSLSQRGLIPLEPSDQSGSCHEESSTHLTKSLLATTWEHPEVINIHIGEPDESIEIVGTPFGRRRALSDTQIKDVSLDSDEDEGTGSCVSTVSSYPIVEDLSLGASSRPKNCKRLSSEGSVHSDMSDSDLDWLDVGQRIGMRILNSEHVQKAMASQETAERISDISKKVESQLMSTSITSTESLDKAKLKNTSLLKATDGVLKGTPESEGRTPTPNGHLGTISPPLKPVHTMWTSPAAALRHKSESSIDSFSDADDEPTPVIAWPQGIPRTRLPPTTDERDRNQALGRTDPSERPAAGASTTRSSELTGRWLSEGNGATNASRTHGDGGDSSECGTEIVVGPLNVKRSPLSRAGSLENVELERSEPRGEDESMFPSRALVREDIASPQLCKTDLNRHRAIKPNKTKTPSQPNIPKKNTRRPNLQPGMKIVVPIFPNQPGLKLRPSGAQDSRLQMATVVKSRRIHLRTSRPRQRSGMSYTNCLSVTVVLDKSFLRGGRFAEMTFRVRDEWSSRYVPRHSKFPIGACVATSFGVGVLVGWRVEDDCHVISSLWHRRGAGSAHAYLNRDAIHGVMEAAVGFDVNTNLGRGTVDAYVHAGRDFRSGRFFVHIKEEGRRKGQILEFAKSNIQSCDGPKYIPVIELFREAARYQLLVDNYNAALREQIVGVDGERHLSDEELFWQSCSKGIEILWTSLLKAVDEDKEFDRGMNEFFSNVIRFLEGLDHPDGKPEEQDGNHQAKLALSVISENMEADGETDGDYSTVASSAIDIQTPGFWFLNDWFGGIFQRGTETELSDVTIAELAKRTNAVDNKAEAYNSDGYKLAFAVIRCLMKSIAIARASCDGEPELRLAFSICNEFLLFIKTVIKVQKRNVTQQSLRIWKRTLDEVVDTIGPIKDRLHKIGVGLAERMKQQGKKAKVRVLRFTDIILADETLMVALERFDWETCLERLEMALVKSKFIDEVSRDHYHKSIAFIYSHSSSSSGDKRAAARNRHKLAAFAKAMKWMASPRQSFLTFLRSDNVLELIERILVRVFRHDNFASRTLAIHASNFHSLRQLRMLKDFTIAGKLWIPILDAANEELHCAVSNMPENARDLMVPLSNLFSLCVAQFHKRGAGDLTADWLKFLMEDEAVGLINEIDMKLILAVEAACKDVKKVMMVLPYYPSIDDDILKLIDEVNLDEFLKEASDAIVDADRFTDFVREKATVAIERFLDYLPKMSIPVKRRELSDGWVLTCHGEDGGDLTLSDATIKRENLCCEVLGGETMFFPMFGHDETDLGSLSSNREQFSKDAGPIETSILDHIRNLLEQTRNDGCWEIGVGGVEKPPSDRYVASVLGGMPVSQVLNCAIELWRNLDIDDDELLEIVIRDVSYQIQLHNAHGKKDLASQKIPTANSKSKSPDPLPKQRQRRRFNPRVDPTVLYFEMKKLSLNLERFHFRIEKFERHTIFDPILEGQGTLQVRNISMKLRVECRKELLETEMTVPILRLQELAISIEKVKFKVKDTGADWILNQAVKSFSDQITETVEANLKEQIKNQIGAALEHLNSYFMINPDLLLGLLGIKIADLEENAVWVWED